MKNRITLVLLMMGLVGHITACGHTHTTSDFFVQASLSRTEEPSIVSGEQLVVNFEENEKAEIEDKVELLETKEKEQAEQLKYTFKKADSMDSLYQSQRLEEQYGQVTVSCILRLYDEDKVICLSEQECALTLGKIWRCLVNR